VSGLCHCLCSQPLLDSVQLRRGQALKAVEDLQSACRRSCCIGRGSPTAPGQTLGYMHRIGWCDRAPQCLGCRREFFKCVFGMHSGASACVYRFQRALPELTGFENAADPAVEIASMLMSPSGKTETLSRESLSIFKNQVTGQIIACHSPMDCLGPCISRGPIVRSLAHLIQKVRVLSWRTPRINQVLLYGTFECIIAASTLDQHLVSGCSMDVLLI